MSYFGQHIAPPRKTILTYLIASIADGIVTHIAARSAEAVGQ